MAGNQNLEYFFAISKNLKEIFKVSLGLFHYLYKLTAFDSVNRSKLTIGEKICKPLKVFLDLLAQNNLKLYKKLIIALFNIMQKNNNNMNHFARILLEASEKCKFDTKSSNSINVSHILQSIAKEENIQSLFHNLLRHSMILIWNDKIREHYPIDEKNVGKTIFDITETIKNDTEVAYTLEELKIERLASPFSTSIILALSITKSETTDFPPDQKKPGDDSTSKFESPPPTTTQQPSQPQPNQRNQKVQPGSSL